jgi:DNA-binding GntR family transcriptional regulator
MMVDDRVAPCPPTARNALFTNAPRRGNRGSVASLPVDTEATTLAYTGSASAGSYAYDELKTLILHGRIRLGVRLREERIAERLGVSRTPAREALLRLNAERFVERHAEGGYQVATPSVRTLRELYEIRRALELFALRRGCLSDNGHDPATIAGLRTDWEALAREADDADLSFVLLDEAFHGSLAEAAGNRRLADELRRVNERIRPVRSQDFVQAGRIVATIEQHLGVLAAIEARDADLGAELLDRHITESQAVVEAGVAETIARMLDPDEDELRW